MSLETKLDSLTIALNRIADLLASSPSMPALKTPAAAGTVPIAEATIPPSAPLPPAPAAEMPALPTFGAAPVAAAPVVPFTDSKTLIEYVMGVYKILGADKGAGINTILVGLGYANINDVKPEHYPAFHAQIEALRG